MIIASDYSDGKTPLIAAEAGKVKNAAGSAWVIRCGDGKGGTRYLCWYIAAATTRGGRLDMTQVFSIPMCTTGLEG